MKRDFFHRFRDVAKFLFIVVCLTGGMSAVHAQDVLMLTDAEGCDTDVIQVELHMTNPDTPVDAFTIRFTFPEAMLDFDSCVQGPLVPSSGWILFGGLLPRNQFPRGVTA